MPGKILTTAESSSLPWPPAIAANTLSHRANASGLPDAMIDICPLAAFAAEQGDLARRLIRNAHHRGPDRAHTRLAGKRAHRGGAG
jgi:hypothetical protein